MPEMTMERSQLTPQYPSPWSDEKVTNSLMMRPFNADDQKLQPQHRSATAALQQRLEQENEHGGVSDKIGNEEPERSDTTEGEQERYNSGLHHERPERHHTKGQQRGRVEYHRVGVGHHGQEEARGNQDAARHSKTNLLHMSFDQWRSEVSRGHRSFLKRAMTFQYTQTPLTVADPEPKEEARLPKLPGLRFVYALQAAATLFTVCASGEGSAPLANGRMLPASAGTMANHSLAVSTVIPLDRFR